MTGTPKRQRWILPEPLPARDVLAAALGRCRQLAPLLPRAVTVSSSAAPTRCRRPLPSLYAQPRLGTRETLRVPRPARSGASFPARRQSATIGERGRQSNLRRRLPRADEAAMTRLVVATAVVCLAVLSRAAGRTRARTSRPSGADDDVAMRQLDPRPGHPRRPATTSTACPSTACRFPTRSPAATSSFRRPTSSVSPA